MSPAPIPSSRDARAAAPRSCWDVRDPDSWRDEIWTLLADIVDAEVKAALVASPPEYLVSDDLSWLDDVILDVRGVDVSSKAFLCARLRERYDSMRAIHGTRCPDVAPFYEKGLLPLDIGLVQTRAKEIFLNGAFPELTEASLDDAIRAMDDNVCVREGRVWFETNEDMLLAIAGHYMVYGGEYLTAIAAHIEGSRDYRQALKQFGTPTVFLCDVPIDLIRPGSFAEFAGSAIELIFQEALDGETHVPDCWRGGGFCIHERLPPSSIVGHYHPDDIQDPLTRWR